jgi:hypothetical protein
MVQVDVFWSYAIGAGCGAAATRATQAARATRTARGRPGRERLADPGLAGTVLFLACVFAPSGVWLLWRFTDWETMHAATRPTDLPPWLVAGFALTNVTQGVLGYLVAQGLWRRGYPYLAWLQMPLGYLAMFFVLAYGWDGSGYRRFLSPTTDAWRAGRLDVPAFLTSKVALTLYGMAAVLVPLLLWLQSSEWARGYAATGVPGPGRIRLSALILLAVFGLGLGGAVLAAVTLTVLGPLVGGAVSVAALVALLHPRGPAGALARAFRLAST